jgi:hypothetical protein
MGHNKIKEKSTRDRKVCLSATFLPTNPLRLGEEKDVRIGVT